MKNEKAASMKFIRRRKQQAEKRKRSKHEIDTHEKAASKHEIDRKEKAARNYNEKEQHWP